MLDKILNLFLISVVTVIVLFFLALFVVWMLPDYLLLRFARWHGGY